MVKWEYLLIPVEDNTQDQKTQLNRLGEEGWELICISESPEGPFFYLKRPKEHRGELEPIVRRIPGKDRSKNPSLPIDKMKVI